MRLWWDDTFPFCLGEMGHAALAFSPLPAAPFGGQGMSEQSQSDRGNLTQFNHNIHFWNFINCLPEGWLTSSYLDIAELQFPSTPISTANGKLGVVVQQHWDGHRLTVPVLPNECGISCSSVKLNCKGVALLLEHKCSFWQSSMDIDSILLLWIVSNSFDCKDTSGVLFEFSLSFFSL